MEIRFSIVNGGEISGRMSIPQNVTAVPLSPATAQTLGGIKVGENLAVTEDGVLSVLTTNDAEADNTRPITSAGTHMILGNIEALLGAI